MMNDNSHNTIMSAKERYLVEDSLVETLDAQRQAEALNPVPVDEPKAAGQQTKEDTAAVNQPEKQDHFMESVRVFIQSIDINSL
jgi:hypothetical protein